MQQQKVNWFTLCGRSLCLWCNYVWVQGVVGLFKRFSGAEAVLVRFWAGGLGKKLGVWSVFFFWVKSGGFLVKKTGGFLVRFRFFFGKKGGVVW